jgi:hypothetical protein
MSEILVEDGESYPSSIVVPEDGDARNAASVVVAFQALADRTKYFFNRLGAFITGGTVATAGGFEWSIASGKTASILGSYGSVLDLSRMPKIKVSGNLVGPLCADASSGRIPHKLALVTSSQTINPVLRSYYICTPSSGDIDLTIDVGSETLVPGDNFLVLNRYTEHAVHVHHGATTFVVPAATLGVPAVQELIWDGLTWVYGRRYV